MASAIGSVMYGLLHSTTTSGMPFTNSTTSGTMNFLACPPGSSTRNWLIARKSLFSGLSQSMNWMRCATALIPVRAGRPRTLPQEGTRSSTR